MCSSDLSILYPPNKHHHSHNKSGKATQLHSPFTEERMVARLVGIVCEMPNVNYQEAFRNNQTCRQHIISLKVNSYTNQIYWPSSAILNWIVPVLIYIFYSQQPGLNVITEYVFGYVYPGNPVANVCFKTFGYISMGQSVSFLNDFKLGHYMKIPPRSMFIVQVLPLLFCLGDKLNPDKSIHYNAKVMQLSRSLHIEARRNPYSHKCCNTKSYFDRWSVSFGQLYHLCDINNFKRSFK